MDGTMESATDFQGKGQEPPLAKGREQEKMVHVIRTSERAEDPRPVLELRENTSSIEELLAGQGHRSNRVIRTIEFSWKRETM